MLSLVLLVTTWAQVILKHLGSHRACIDETWLCWWLWSPVQISYTIVEISQHAAAGSGWAILKIYSTVFSVKKDRGTGYTAVVVLRVQLKVNTHALSRSNQSEDGNLLGSPMIVRRHVKWIQYFFLIHFVLLFFVFWKLCILVVLCYV